MATVDKSLVGRKVRLLSGAREEIVRATSAGYKTESGHVIPPDAIETKGRSIVELKTKGSKPVAVKKKEDKSSKATTKASAPAKGKGKIDASSMSRKECVTHLVKTKQLPVRAAARGLSVADLRAAVESGKPLGGSGKTAKAKPEPEAKATPKAKAKTKPEAKPSKKAKAEREEPAPKSKKGKVPRREEPEAKPSKKAKAEPKKISGFSEKLVARIQKAVDAELPDWLRDTVGVDFTVAGVYGTFNDDRCLLSIGLLPTTASEQDSEDFANELSRITMSAVSGQESEEEEAEAITAEDLAGITGVDVKKVRKYMKEFEANFDDSIEPLLGDEVMPGTRLDREGNPSIVLGFIEDKGKLALFDTVEEKTVGVSVAKVVHMEILEAEEADEEEEDDTDEFEQYEDDADFDSEDEEEEGDEEEEDEEDDESDEEDDESDEEDDESDEEDDESDEDEEEEDDDSDEDEDDFDDEL